MKPVRSGSPDVVNESTGVVLRSRSDQEAIATAAAREFVRVVAGLQASGNTVTGDGMVRVALTGGGAGIATLRELAALDRAAHQVAEDFPILAIDWSRVYVFFGDERFLPAGNPERNDKQAHDALLRHIDIPELNIYRYHAPKAGSVTDGPELDAAAADYAETVDSVAPDGFDLHLLGMGPEGHINSLFPHTDELLRAEGSVVAVRNCPKAPAERVSLTLSAVNRCARVWLLVAGEAKKEAAAEVFNGGNVAQWPAAGVSGIEETVLWVDAAANPIV